ncbi:hypothetical protein GW17_00018916, partial [Ensete ventricosum]
KLLVGNAPGYLSGKDFSTLDGSVRSILQDIPGIDTQGNSSRYGDFQWNILGMKLDAFPLEDEEDAVSMRSQNLEPVKVNSMDLDDLSLSNSFCFRLTLSCSTRCRLVSISHYIFIRLHICVDSLIFALSCT